MRNGLIIFVVAIATCSCGRADEPSLPAKSENEASLRVVIERLEARVSELETQLQQVKQAQQQMIIGSSLLDVTPFLVARELDSASTMRVNKAGIIVDVRGRRVGYWGFDAPLNEAGVPVPNR